VQPHLIEPKMEQLLQKFSAMEKLFAGYIKARLDSYLKILQN
jgi:hypothetical protein